MSDKRHSEIVCCKTLRRLLNEDPETHGRMIGRQAMPDQGHGTCTGPYRSTRRAQRSVAVVVGGVMGSALAHRQADPDLLLGWPMVAMVTAAR